jgi:hypothetical protein
MASAVFSQHWHRVADLHPRVRSHVQVDRHCYRGQIWHVLKDRVSGRQHRLNEVAWSVVGRLDGRRSVQTIWEAALHDLGDDAPSQPEVVELLARLHAAELIATEASARRRGDLRPARRTSAPCARATDQPAGLSRDPVRPDTGARPAGPRWAACLHGR